MVTKEKKRGQRNTDLKELCDPMSYEADLVVAAKQGNLHSCMCGGQQANTPVGHGESGCFKSRGMFRKGGQTEAQQP